MPRWEALLEDRPLDRDPARSPTLPSNLYTSPEVFAREREAIFFKSWHLAGHVSDLPEPGSYITAAIHDQGVFICRGKDGRLRGFYNVCAHRAHELLTGTGRARVITCPYHAWSYHLTGELRSARGAEALEGFEPKEFCLTPVKVETVGPLVFYALWTLVSFIHTEVGWTEVGRVLVLGCYTMLRVVLLIALAALVWIPVGVRIGMNPRLAERSQAILQFLAAFPANLMFPVAVVLLVRFKLNPDIWLSPLMILGTQWYLLFNVIAGASTIPTELRYAAQNLQLEGSLRWRRYLLPAIFPSFVTGAITASGGSWNASIVAEYVTWGDTTLEAHGIGSYIAEMTAKGDFPRIALGIAVMCIFVMGFNHFLWRRLYRMTEERLHF